MARNEEKQLGRLNRLLLEQQKEGLLRVAGKVTLDRTPLLLCVCTVQY